jgi:hypothetical protein
VQLAWELEDWNEGQSEPIIRAAAAKEERWPNNNLQRSLYSLGETFFAYHTMLIYFAMVFRQANKKLAANLGRLFVQRRLPF